MEATGANLLMDLHYFFSGWNFWVCLGMHCLFAATMAPDLKDKFLIHYWTTFLAGFGGGFLSSLLMMRPDIAPLPLFGHNYEGLLWTFAWWAVNYFPFNIVGRLVQSGPIMTIIMIGSNFCRAGLMALRVDQAVELYPGIIVAPIILGTIGGMAGKVFLEAIRVGVGMPTDRHEIAYPGYVWRSGFFGTVLYYVAVHITGAISKQEGLAMLRAILIVHCIFSRLTGMPLDYTSPLAFIGHKVVNVPHPFTSTAQAENSNNAGEKKKESKKNK